jgi:putative redox protein
LGKDIQVQVIQRSATTSEGSVRGHNVLIDRPLAKEGTDRGAMGGELLLIALGGCFMSNLLAAIRAREADISDVVIDITGTLTGSPPRYTAIEMIVSATHDDPALLEKLVIISERSCIVANTLKNSVELSIAPDKGA